MHAPQNSQDFGFLFFTGLGTFLVQLSILSFCTSVSDIFGTFTLRLVTYTIAVLARAALGFGGVGRILRLNRKAVALVGPVGVVRPKVL